MTTIETLETKLQKIIDSLDRGMAVIAPLEDAYRAEFGSLPDVVELPEGELKAKLEAWQGLLCRYEETQKQIRKIKPVYSRDITYDYIQNSN